MSRVRPAPHFATLREIAARNGVGKLSKGMSDDFEIAIPPGRDLGSGRLGDLRVRG